MVIQWTESALNDLHGIYDYIKEFSPANATKVRNAIYDKVSSLAANPEMYAKESLLSHLEKNIRSVSLWSYKVVYEVVFKDDEIWILRVFHTAQNPQKLMDSFL